MNGFVTKPITLERLRAVLEQSAPRASPVPPRIESADRMLLDEAFLNHLAQEITPDGVAEMIRIFLEDAPPRVLAIQRAAADGSIQIIGHEAHALSGSDGNVGLNRLAEAASALQRACEKTEPDSVTIEILAAIVRDSLPLVTVWADAHETLVTSLG